MKTAVKFFYLILFLLSLSACNTEREVELLSDARDSIKRLKSENAALLSTIQEAKSILDSIDAKYAIIDEKIPEQESMVLTLYQVKNYLKNTDEHIVSLQHQLKRSRNEAEAYLLISDALKSELDFRDENIGESEKDDAALSGSFAKKD